MPLPHDSPYARARGTREVADGVDTRLVRFPERSGDHVCVFDVDAGLLKPQILYVAANPDGLDRAFSCNLKHLA